MMGSTYFLLCIFIGFLHFSDACDLGSTVWQPWQPCSKPCGGGTQKREGESCFWGIDKEETRNCNEFCYNEHPYYFWRCHCPSWRTGRCCETCGNIYIQHCITNNQRCGGSPDNVMCTKCVDDYYSGGYGGGCKACPTVANCADRHCTTVSNTKCRTCVDDNVFYKRTNSDTKCERMCSFDTNPCWPGKCSDELTSSCKCADGFRQVRTRDHTTCQLSIPPSINTCRTTIKSKSGDAVPIDAGPCDKQKDFFGNYQPALLLFTMESDFLTDFDIPVLKYKPNYIAEEQFGITDTSINTLRFHVLGTSLILDTFKQKIDTNLSTQATSTVNHKGNYSIEDPKYHLRNGERLCVEFEARGGGYVKTLDFRKTPPAVQPPVPYEKITKVETVCYRFDDAKPEHCIINNSCPKRIKEPLQIENRVTRSDQIPISFLGWFDPIPTHGNSSHASGVEFYEITVNTVLNGIVNGKSTLTKKVNAPVTNLTLNLTSDGPILYSISARIKDVANNIQTARRFVLFDNTTTITTNKDNPFIVTSASKSTNYKWQTHHHDICLNWKDHFLNRYYMENNLLGKINITSDPNGHIESKYEQTTGTLPVNGTKHVYGITHFYFASSLNRGTTSNETLIPDFTKQVFCKTFLLKDGESYTLSIKAVDIANNILSKNRTVHIDRSVPHINNIGLIKNGTTRLFVHDSIDLSKMNLSFEALDPHSGIQAISWSFQTVVPSKTLGSGYIGPINIDHKQCSSHPYSCYCPDVGDCQMLVYSIPLNSNNTHIGNHNRDYVFTIKATNKAGLSNIERIDVLVDDSPPEVGVISEGVAGAPDIDYTSDSSYIVNWKGFIDHESGIKEYRVGIADSCLDKCQLLNNDQTANITESRTVLFTESSVRIGANFTGKKYASILAINNAYEASDVVCSDGITRDNTPPKLLNIKLLNGRWSESLYCENGSAWLLRSDVYKLKLVKSQECIKACRSDSPSVTIFNSLPVATNGNIKDSVSEFMCKNLDMFGNTQIIYLPSDAIDISWNIEETGSQIEDFYVGFSLSSDVISPLSIMGYKSTSRKSHFRMRHIGVGSGELFYAHIKTVNKAKLETLTVFGPILIDETPPSFNTPPSVFVDYHYVTVGWTNDSVVDMEQPEGINQMLFQIVHDSMAVSPFHEWKRHDSEPCLMFTGGCFKYPLKRLQSSDNDMGLSFAIKVHAYNNAGHYTSTETKPFKIPSRYPPGHAVILDTDPKEMSSSSTHQKDISVHFTANKLCAQWKGFKHHENVSVEVGIGTRINTTDVIPFQMTNASDNSVCVESVSIGFYVKYIFHARVSCSGGSSTSTSNGVIIANATHLKENIQTIISESNTLEKTVWTKKLLNENEVLFCPVTPLKIGRSYELVVHNITRNASVLSQIGLIILQRLYDNASATINMTVLPKTEKHCLLANPSILDTDDVTVYTTSQRNDQSNNTTTILKSGDKMSIALQYIGEDNVLKYLKYVVAIAKSANYNDSLMNQHVISKLTNWQGTNRHSIETSSLQFETSYVALTKLCTAVECVGPILSQEFEIESSITGENILASTIANDDLKGCADINISWKAFQARSNITMYQWFISKDENAVIILTDRRTLVNEGHDIYNVTECINLPVSIHSTLYLCLSAFSEAGNTVTTCQRASVMNTEKSSKSILYDLDASSGSWKEIEQMIHSSDIGSTYTLLNDAEMDFGNLNTSVVGTIMYATERNVTWFLTSVRKVPSVYDCDGDTDCIISIITDSGYVIFNNNIIQSGRVFYICAHSNATSVERELFTDELTELQSCSDGFIIDDAPPTGGHVTIANTNGFITSSWELKIIWTGFDDNVNAESLGYSDRIKYFSYALGTRPGGEDITNYTIVGNIRYVIDHHQALKDGDRVYASVKATDHAGLSSEVYSKENIVDTSPPVTGTINFNGNSSYHSSTTIIVNLSDFKDDQSGIDHYEVALGTEDDLKHSGTIQIFTIDRIYMELPNDIHEGHLYFIVVRAINRAGLSSLSVEKSFLLDLSAPSGGHVIDGNWQNNRDIGYQKQLHYIQGHWKGFIDTQSGIKSYSVGLGTRPKLYDVESLMDVGLKTDQTWNGTYEAGKKYYITVEACNHAELCRSISSNGVILDNSPPIGGIVRVGSKQQHNSFLPTGASVHISWFGFADPQSGLDHYEYCIGTKPFDCNVVDYTHCLLQSSIIKTKLNLINGTNYYASVKAINRAGLSEISTSDAFAVDDTPPVLINKPAFIFNYNTISGEKAQWEKSVLRMSWKFADNESKVATHTISLKTHHEGHTPVENVHLGDVDSLTIGLHDNNWLNNGDRYFVVVTSCNTAGLCTRSHSENVLIDFSPPHLGGFKPPMSWQNFIDDKNTPKSKIDLIWYGFIDAESSVYKYYITASRNYTGYELSGGIFTTLSKNITKDQNATLTLKEPLIPDELLILTIWAQNAVGLNSSVARISVNVLTSDKTDLHTASGILEIQKYSCDTHFCNKDCTCAVIGTPCVDVSTDYNCSAYDNNYVSDKNLPYVDVYGGLFGSPQNITTSSACLSGHWQLQGEEFMIQRYEWSMGIKGQPVGEGIFDLKRENPWNDVGKRTEGIQCLSYNRKLEHGENYIIYVRVWYSKDTYAEFLSNPIMVDLTPPHVGKGKHIKDSDVTCRKDFDVIDWMDTLTACWDGVFTERQGDMVYFYISMGTSINGSDTFQRTNVGLRTSYTLGNLTLTHGTKYYVTVTAYNSVGLHTTMSSDGFVVDMDVPISGVVFNTAKHTDTSYQSSNTTFNISWHGFIDHFSGIRSYRVAVVSDNLFDFNNVSFVNVGLQTKHTFRNLLLQHGASYKGVVQAIDNAGHVSQFVVSNPKSVDATPPKPFQCSRFVPVNISPIDDIDSCSVSFYHNITNGRYYSLKGLITGETFHMRPSIKLGNRHHTYLPVTVNSNNSVTFQYHFLSPISGKQQFTISALDHECKGGNVSINVEMETCDTVRLTEDYDRAVDVRQLGPSQLVVSSRVVDSESSLYKIQLGAGTSPRGFQLHPLTVIYDSSSSVINVDANHRSEVFVTVIAKNHAGLVSVFKATPVVIDKSPPVMSGLNVEINEHIHDTNDTSGVNVAVKWTISDKESSIKYCTCSIGSTKGTDDVSKELLSETHQSCQIPNLNLHNGDSIYAQVKCINSVELATKVISQKIVVSLKAPISSKAKSHFVSLGNSASLQIHQSMQNKSDAQIYFQTDHSIILLEWSGFEDVSGIDQYEYKLTCQNVTIVDWTKSGAHTMVEMKGLRLSPGNRYMSEVRAVNQRQFRSEAVTSEIVIQSNGPELTGKRIMTTGIGDKLQFDWCEVYRSTCEMSITYDVLIGSKKGYTDILQLQRIDTCLYDVTVPRETIITPIVNELYIVVVGTYPTGMFTVYQTTYIL